MKDITPNSNNSLPAKKSFFQRFLGGVETVGNKLPHPVAIFLILCVVVAIASHILSLLGLNVNYEGINTSTYEKEMMTVEVQSLLSVEGIKFIFTSAVTNFTGFAPLGTVLVAMIGVGLAEGTGLISALIRKLVLSTPKRLLTAVVVFAGVMSNVASDAGYLVLVPLGAAIFYSVGRHPIAGLAAAFAGVSGGFSANLLLSPTDSLLGGITKEAAKIGDASYFVQEMTGNYYFLFVSTFLITILGTFVCEKIVEPSLGKYTGNVELNESTELSSDEKRGLKYALISLILIILFLAVLSAPANAPLRNAETGKLFEKSPFMDGIVFIIMLLFMVPGIAFGVGKKIIKNDKDVVDFATKAMASMGGYLVLAFAISQFVAYFNYSKMGTVIAVNGANALDTIGFKGLPLVIAFILVTAFINLFMGSASAKWAIMAPIFVPMLMGIGFTPEFTQVAYRIGDSSTNIISPLMSYFALIVVFAEKYDKKAGIGTIISTMLPFSLVFLIGWSLLLVVWFLLGLPIGPGTGIYLP